MLGLSWFRSVKRLMPWNQGIAVKVISAKGYNIFLENLSDSSKKKNVIRRYYITVEPTANYFVSQETLTDYVGSVGFLDFHKNELWLLGPSDYGTSLYGRVAKDIPRYA